MNEITPIDVNPDTWTIQRVLNWSVDYLRKKGCESPRVDSEVLLAASLGCKRIELYTNFDKPMANEERAAYRAMLQRRAASEPVAYIIGFKEFFGRAFKVNSGVLIPRPETEHLVEQVREFAATMPEQLAFNLLDVGTGSGCIAVSLASALPHALVTAWDISPAALILAAQNAAAHQVDGRISFQERNALDSLSWSSGAHCFEAIVANPPYIADHERATLPPDVRDFEPEIALFAGADGLNFYRVLADHAAAVLTPEGKIFLEIGSAQSANVSELFAANGWREVTVLPDLAGLPRVLRALAPARRN